MTRHIDAETLRVWLEENRPVTVLDVRSEEDRSQWSIPGSIHLDVYDALKAGTQSALSEVELPSGSPVVTVCNLGKMSERAAAELSARGLEALSLAGGMKAWSLAWNTADLALANINVLQVRRTGKGCLSYLVSSGSEAIVIDASLPPEVYLSLAKDRDVRIKYVLDTHIHADHLSRSRLLAERAAAELLLPAQDRVRFPYRALTDGTVLNFGPVRLQALATPGHTIESTSYLVDGDALFTGDTLFIGSVGRPDLHADMERARDRAGLLYHSVTQLLALGPQVLLFPGHTSAPAGFDGVAVAERLGAVAAGLGVWMVSETEFVDRILARIPPTPPNYERIVELNERGELPQGDPTDLEAGANRCAVS